jgi:hypothetical protein
VGVARAVKGEDGILTPLTIRATNPAAACFSIMALRAFEIGTAEFVEARMTVVPHDIDHRAGVQ